MVCILTCKHFFHKNCIDPWILAHGTCPMCKCDILKAFEIQVGVEDGTESLQFLMSDELLVSCHLVKRGQITNFLPQEDQIKWPTWRRNALLLRMTVSLTQ